MNPSTSPPSPPPAATSTPWGDRNVLIPKRLQYVLTMEFVAGVTALHLNVQPRDGAIRHLFEQSVATLPDGTRADLPLGRIEAGDGRMGTETDPTSSALTLRISARLGSAAAPVLIACSGVVNFDGGPQGLHLGGPRYRTGTAFVATRHETASATYRWLNRRQLFGTGRAVFDTESDEMAFTFDLYASG